MVSEQTEADWWRWAHRHLLYKPPEQIEHAARQLAFTYRWAMPKDQVVAKLLGNDTEQ